MFDELMTSQYGLVDERKFIREHKRAIAHEFLEINRFQSRPRAYVLDGPHRGDKGGVRVMRNLFLGVTIALALGVVTIPNVAMAGHHSGGHMGMSHGSFTAGGTATRNIGNRALVNRNVVINRNVNRNFAVSRNFNNRFAFNDRHHRHHNHFFYPGFFYGDSYASYDSCYQYAWTPYGYRYVNVCGPNYYYGYY